jgi:hypothetical protein
MPKVAPTGDARLLTQDRDLAAELDALRAEVRSRNEDLTDEQAVELVDRLSREVIDEMAAEGTLTFERDR